MSSENNIKKGVRPLHAQPGDPKAFVAKNGQLLKFGVPDTEERELPTKRSEAIQQRNALDNDPLIRFENRLVKQGTLLNSLGFEEEDLNRPLRFYERES